MKFPSSLRNLLLGAGGAAIVNFSALSLSAHFVSEADFGIFAVFSSLASIFSVISNYRFDIAICQKSDDDRAYALFVLALLSALIFGSLISLFAFSGWGVSLLSYVIPVHVNFNGFMGLLGFSIFFIGFYQAAQALALYQKRYKQIAMSKWLQAIIAAVIQIVVAVVFDGGYVALALGFVIGQGLGMAMLIDFSEIFGKMKRNIVSIHSSFLENFSFCTSSSVATLFLMLSPMLPTLFLSSLIGINSAGLFFFAVQITSAPFSIVRRVLANLVLAELRGLNVGAYCGVVKKIKRKWLHLAVPLFLFFVLYYSFAPVLFAKVFGSAWYKAGEVSALLLPMLLIDTISFSYFQVLNVKSEKFLLFVVEVFRFVAVVIGVWLVAWFSRDLTMVAAWYSLSMFLVYTAICWIGHRKIIKNEIANS